MNYFEHATTLLEKQLGYSAVISLATCAGVEVTVRNVDACYRDGAVYIFTYKNSQKMRQLAIQPNVGLCKSYNRTRPFYEGLLQATGIGKDIGHPRGHQLKGTLQDIFDSESSSNIDWDNPQARILKITLTTAIIYDGEYKYSMDFITQEAERTEHLF